MDNIAIIGAGNLGQAIAEGIVNNKLRNPDEVILTRRNIESLQSFMEAGFDVTTDNEAAVSKAKMVLLCVQPKQLETVLEPFKEILTQSHVLISVITGITINEISLQTNGRPQIIRAMPNTAISIGESMTCICANSGVSPESLDSTFAIFKVLGEVLYIEEKLMKAATVLGASGIAFFMRYLRAATQGGIEMGFHPEEAQRIAVQTAKGAASLIKEHNNHPEEEIDKVTTPQGCTIAGLNEMEHQGLSSALIKGLLTSFEKINSIKSDQ